MDANTSLLLSVNDFALATPWLYGPLELYAGYGLVVFAGLLLAGWWTARKTADPARMAAALWAPLGMLLALALNQPIGAVVNEARPYASLPNILVLATPTADPSFPSDHAMVAGAVTAALFLVDRRLGWVSALAAVLMAFSRVYIAAHYPLDVVVGLLLGAEIGLARYFLLRRVLLGVVVALQHTRFRPFLNAAPRGVGS